MANQGKEQARHGQASRRRPVQKRLIAQLEIHLREDNGSLGRKRCTLPKKGF
jgi:hypothetical protein